MNEVNEVNEVNEDDQYMDEYFDEPFPKNGFAMPAMILGIIGFVIGIIPFIGWFAVPLSLMAIVFGFLGLSGYTNRGQAITGIVLGFVLIIWKIGFWVMIIILGILLE